MVCCAITGCSNHDRHQKAKGIKFHIFPKDDETNKKWVNACKRADKFSTKTARVCSHHFDDSDYLRDLKNELLNLPLKRILKPDAIPHLNLPIRKVDCESSRDLERKLRLDKWNNRKQVQQILEIYPKDNDFCENSLQLTTERQNVRKAAQLFSLTVGKAIKYNFPEFTHVAESIIVVNNGFDVLNSRIPICGTYNLKSAYGTCIEEQDDALEKLFHLISTIRVIGSEKKKTTTDSLLPFQKGFLTSIESLRGLYKELKSEGYSYIMSSRCNQDILESYFSQIRGLGRFYDHPLPTTVTQRIKSLILSRHASEVITSGNCRTENGMYTFTADILSKSCQNTIDGTLDDEQNKQIQEEKEMSTQTDNGDEENCDEDEEFTTAVEGLLNHFQECENETVSDKVKEKTELLEMIAGYIAYKIKKKHPERANTYGSMTKDLAVPGKNWLHTISRGSLMKPSTELLENVTNMEIQFNKFHGSYINQNPKVFTNLKTKIKSVHPDIDDCVIMNFVRTRSFIRMKSLNKRKRTEKGNKRSFYESDNRKTNKKMRKIVQ